jgi:hypothetical protein
MMHKSKLLNQLQKANTNIKQKTSRAQSRLSNLENDLLSLKKNLNEETQNKLEEMREVVDSLKLEKKAQILKIPHTLRRLKVMAFELIEGIVSRRRLATFHNTGIIEKLILHPVGQLVSHPVICE